MLIDVRTPTEYNLEHLDKAINIPIDELDTVPLPVKPQEEIVLHCRTGMRARLAQHILLGRGFKKVSLLNGTGSL